MQTRTNPRERDRGGGKHRYRKVLVLVKETYLEQVLKAGDEAQLADIRARRSGVESVQASHLEHEETLALVVKTLESAGLEVVPVRQLDDFARLVPDVDLIVTVGGDGTFLRISHEVQTAVPVLGVNSAPITSFGHFCLTDRHGFPAVLAAILRSEIQPIKLLRLRLTLNGVQLREPVLNEVLVAHKHPAGTSRYQISVRGKSANHKGSGLLIAAPSGSTGFLRSEGGPVLPITSRCFAYQKRAPFLRLFEKQVFLKGTVKAGETMRLVSQMQGGKLFVDGEHIEYDFPRGAILTVEAAEQDLVAFVDPGCHTPYLLERKLYNLPLLGSWSKAAAAILGRTLAPKLHQAGSTTGATAAASADGFTALKNGKTSAIKAWFSRMRNSLKKRNV
ncbi:MAG: NAD(+)/NADH kinase [Candidatus Obscuribacter sp.]|nr:NAD(+)/NADH kinase [Candidatus Obscuribacter sp.]MBK9280227.1 NAD(+)/NADH kinase [Candidatus Obscuribacter sp.]